MNMKKNIEIYGVVTSVEYLHASGILLNVKEDETGIDWEVGIVDKWVDSDYLKEGFHLFVQGDKGIGKHSIWAEYIDRWGRYCTHCGKHHEEGYWIHEHEYACSDECAIAILGGKEQYDDAMNEYDDDANWNPICWVEWYN